MARVQYSGIIDDLTGRLNNSVFQRNKSGYIIRSVGSVKRSSTASQQAQHNNLYMYLALYSGLSFSNKLLWKDFADTYTRVNNYGRTMQLSGQNWFVLINSNRVLCGNPVILQPPVYEIPPGGNDFRIFWGEDGYQIRHNDGDVGTGIYFKIENTTILRNNLTGGVRFLRYCSIQPLIYRNMYELTAEYEAVHNIDLSVTAGKIGTICITRLTLIDGVSGINSPAISDSNIYTLSI